MAIDKVEIRVRKSTMLLGALFLIGMALAPLYYIDFNNLVPQDVIIVSAGLGLCYISYRFFLKRVLMGPIITLTNDSMVVKDENTVYTYRWTTIKTLKVAVVTEKDAHGKNTSRTMLSVWTLHKNTPDEFSISGLEMKGDEIRELIYEYFDRASRKNSPHLPESFR